MSTSRRQKERYRADPAYRARQIARATAWYKALTPAARRVVDLGKRIYGQRQRLNATLLTAERQEKALLALLAEREAAKVAALNAMHREGKTAT